LHDRGAPDPRLGGAGRSEPPTARREGPRRRPQPADRRLPGEVRAFRVLLRLDRRRTPRPRREGAVVAAVQETIQVQCIRSRRCMARLGHVLKGHDGLESANATLAGEVTLAWDDEVTSREALLEAMLKGGFREIPT